MECQVTDRLGMNADELRRLEVQRADLTQQQNAGINQQTSVPFIQMLAPITSGAVA